MQNVWPSSWPAFHRASLFSYCDSFCLFLSFSGVPFSSSCAPHKSYTTVHSLSISTQVTRVERSRVRCPAAQTPQLGVSENQVRGGVRGLVRKSGERVGLETGLGSQVRGWGTRGRLCWAWRCTSATLRYTADGVGSGQVGGFAEKRDEEREGQWSQVCASVTVRLDWEV